MNEEKKTLKERLGALPPLFSTLLKLYIPVLTVLAASGLILMCIYAVTDNYGCMLVARDCLAALRSCAGTALLTLLIARVLENGSAVK